MPDVRPIRAEAGESVYGGDETMHPRAVESKMRARRRWVIRSMLILSLTAVALLLVMMWRRDQSTIDTELQRLHNPLITLQQEIDRLKWLPAYPPDFRNMYYANDSERYYAMHADEPAILAIGPRKHLALKEDGQCVVFYYKGKVSDKWMPNSEFLKASRQWKQKMKDFDERRSAPPKLP